LLFCCSLVLVFFGIRGAGHLDFEDCTRVRGIARGQAAAEFGDDPRRDRQSKPNPVAGLLGGEQGLEQLVQLVDPVAIVADRQFAGVAGAHQNVEFPLGHFAHGIQRIT